MPRSTRRGGNPGTAVRVVQIGEDLLITEENLLKVQVGLVLLVRFYLICVLFFRKSKNL